MSNNDINWRCINTIRTLCADVVQKADSGHPGAPLGMAPLAHLLWSKVMNYSPSNHTWINRDRFVLSNGHACALLYTMLHLTGYEEYPLDELKKFRQLGSKCPGHPENHFSGIEVTTGPLGQGFSNAVGLAIAQAHIAALYNKPGFELFNNKTYVTAGDGCLMEGVASEAASLAGHLGLGGLIVFYDDNHISIDGSTEITFTEDVQKRFESYGWHVQVVADGDHDLKGLQEAISNAQKVTDRPSLIKVRTTIGYGSKLAGTAKVHGAPLGKEGVELLKKKLGFNPEQEFYVPPEVRAAYNGLKLKGNELEQEWNQKFKKYAAAHPDLARDLQQRLKGELPKGWSDVLPRYKPGDKAIATRQASQAALQKLTPVLPGLFGGSADLVASNLCLLPGTPDFQKTTPEGKNIRFGVREHAMAAICNGLAGFSPSFYIPFAATFLNFIAYAQGAVILSALSCFGVIYIMTHDSIGLGEDGPTHQPIEKLLTCRATPNLLVIRPADGNETSGAYLVAVENRKRPSVLSLCRQNVPQLAGSSVEAVRKGAYVLQEAEGGRPQVILTGTGSEVSIAVEAADKLKAKGVRVRLVSFPCWELFEEQTSEYQDSVFLPGVPVVSIEAATTLGWQKWATASVGLDTFGFSGPAKDVYKRAGITTEKLVETAEAVLKNPNRSRL